MSAETVVLSRLMCKVEGIESSMLGHRHVERSIDKCMEKYVEMPCCPTVLIADVALHNTRMTEWWYIVVSMLASGTQDRGFDPSRNHRIFWAKKIHSMPSLGGK